EHRPCGGAATLSQTERSALDHAAQGEEWRAGERSVLTRQSRRPHGHEGREDFRRADRAKVRDTRGGTRQSALSQALQDALESNVVPLELRQQAGLKIPPLL